MSPRQFQHCFTATWMFREPFDRAKLRLRVRPQLPAEVLSHRWTISPTPADVHESRDEFGTLLIVAEVGTSASQLNIEAESLVRFPPVPETSDRELRRGWEELCQPINSAASAPSTWVTRDAEFAEYAAQSFPPGRPWRECVQDLADRLRQDLHYDASATSERSAREAFNAGRGTCQDFAHVTLACLRSLSVPSAYIHGCLLEPSPPAADRSHAWVRVYDSPRSWQDVDPLTGQLVDEAIVLAVGLDASNAAPVLGEIQGGESRLLTVTNWVERM